MSQPEMKQLDVEFTSAKVPVHYVNMADIRASANGELFVTVGSVFPPDLAEMEAVQESGKIIVYPTFRFAMSYDIAKRVLEVAAKQMDILENLRGE